MQIRAFLLSFFLVISGICFSQLPRLSDNANISILTCGSGDELFSAFGHTAIRLQDSVLGIDVVYNYGTFDFNQPNFYLNFAKGRMLYSLSRRNFEHFLYEYELEKRWIKEQILDLTLQEKNKLFQFLENNYLPENRDYRYDPLFDNCSTIAGSIINEQLNDKVAFNGTHLKQRYTFRQLIMQHLHWNSWSAFGINLAYGSVVDRKATVQEHMFLPYYAMYQLRNTSKGQKPILLRERTILDYADKVQNGYFATSPLFWLVLLLLFVIAITYFDRKYDHKNRWLDFILFFISGFMGCFMLTLWLATDHTSTVNNFNILWALPLNLVVGFFLLSKKTPEWLPMYLWFALSLLVLTSIIWIFQVQVFSPLILILMSALALRYLFLLKKI